MTQRRRFLQVIGGGAVAFGTLGTGCGSTVAQNATGPGGGGAGGSGAGGTPGTGGSSTSTSTSSSSTSASSSASSSSGAMCEMTPAGLKIGKPSDYATMGLHIVTNSGVLVGRDSGGLYALTAICTHQSCDMSAVDNIGPFGQIQGMDIVCLCHGSEFSPSGSVVQGPACCPLKAYALALGCDGFLYVDKSKHVANTVRLMA